MSHVSTFQAMCIRADERRYGRDLWRKDAVERHSGFNGMPGKVKVWLRQEKSSSMCSVWQKCEGWQS